MNIKKLTASLLLFVMSVTLIGVLPQKAYALTCGFGADNGAGQCVGTLHPGVISWTVPTDWSSTNAIECIGSGGNGSARQTSSIAGTGGGGGAYAKRSNVTGLSGSITVSIDAAGGTASTTFNSSVSGKEVVCDWGRSGTTAAAGVGGSTAASIGDTKFAGGNGFKPASGSSGGGGGGAAGLSGAGTSATTNQGGAANNNTNPSPAICSGNSDGASGNTGNEYGNLDGAGSGASGGCGSGQHPGGVGGAVGGGGGGSNTGSTASGGSGNEGLIAITYTPTASAPTVVTNAADTVTATSANMNGNVTADGGATVTARGFATSTVSTLASSVSTSTLSGTTGAYSATFSNTNLTGNTTYYFRAYATNSVGTSFGSIQNFLTLPDVPGTPTYTNTIATTTGVTWSVPTGGSSTYKLEQCITSTNTCSLFTGITSNATTTYSLTGNTNYEYAVLGTNATGDGAFSATSTPVLTLPGLPTAFTFGVVTATTTAVSWTQPAGNAASYTLTVCNGASCNVYANISGNSTTTYNLTGNTNYSYSLIGTNATGNGLSTATTSQLTLPDVPGAPTYSSVTLTSMSVNWSAPSATSYNLERCITSTNTCTLTTGISSPPQTVNSLTSNTSYDFAVQGVNATGSGTWSATSTQLTAAGAPTVTTTIVDSTTITANSAFIAGNITDIGSGNATARGFASSTDPLMVTGVATTTESGSFAVGAFPSSPGAFPGSMSGLTSNTTYYFRAFATNTGGTGFGAIGSLLTLPAAPGTPTYTNTIATTTGISWTDPTGATTYNLEQCITSTNTCSLFTNISSNATTTYSLTGNTNYEYAVLGTNATGNGAFSATSTPVLTLPDKPGTPTFSNITASNALASWTAAAGGAASYKLEICDGGGGCSLFINISSNSTTTYSLAANSSYTVAVRGTNATGDGLWSATSTLTTTLTTPGTPTYSATIATTTSVTWSASSGASSYKLEQCITGSNTCSLFTGITSNATTTYSLTGNTSYDYAVRATAASDSAFSATSTVLTLPNVPGTPAFTNIAATTLTVNWAGSVGSSSSYKIERCSGGGCSNFSQIASGIGTTTYNDTGLSNSTTYNYRVRGNNATGDGLYSAAASVTTNAPSGNTGGGRNGGADLGGNVPPQPNVTGGSEGGGQVIGNDPGFNQPSSSGSGIATGWSVGWATPANGFASDNAYATSNATSSTDYSVFGFAVPSTDTVTGIMVKLEASASAGGGTIKVELSWNGGTATTTSGFTTSALTTSDVVYTLGSASANWGRTWAPADLSDANLRVRIVAVPSSGNTVKLDAIQVNVFHQATGGSSGGGGDI